MITGRKQSILSALSVWSSTLWFTAAKIMIIAVISKLSGENVLILRIISINYPFFIVSFATKFYDKRWKSRMRKDIIWANSGVRAGGAANVCDHASIIYSLNINILHVAYCRIFP